jgi:hypothetical protein
VTEMCLLLCANSITRQWVEAVAGRYERDMLQEMHACKCDGLSSADGRVVEIECCTLDEHAVEKIPRGPKLRDEWPSSQAVRDSQRGARSRLSTAGASRPSLYEWKSPSNALAYAWSRLLALIGWRR